MCGLSPPLFHTACRLCYVQCSYVQNDLLMSSFPFLTLLLSLCPKVFRWSVLHTGEPGLCGKGSWAGRKADVVLLTAFSLNMIFTNRKCMLFPKYCPRVSLGFVPWKPLFPARQGIPGVCRRSCSNSPLGFFLCLVLAGCRRRLELSCEMLMASQHHTLCFCNGVASVLPSLVAEGEWSC